MRIVKDKIWTWFLPDEERTVNQQLWFDCGGKWLIFDRQEKILKLAYKLEKFIDSGEIDSAKTWSGDPRAINVYTLDKNCKKVNALLVQLGAKHHKVWEYDYAWDKNIRRPIDFLYSWLSKFITIIRSKGMHGTVELFKELMTSD